MLECSSLWIGPWKEAAGRDLERWNLSAGESVRLLADGTNRADLGFAREAGGARRGWWSWLGRRNLEVCETEDASLVFSLRRGWWRNWDICDAEEHLVGAVYRSAVLDERGLILARMRRGGGFGQFVAPNHGVMATWTPGPGGEVHLSFTPTALDSPFVRMALLGAVLTW